MDIDVDALDEFCTFGAELTVGGPELGDLAVEVPRFRVSEAAASSSAPWINFEPTAISRYAALRGHYASFPQTALT